MLVAQSCLILYNPMDCSPPSSSVRGIFQARILEWFTISSSRGYSGPRDQTYISFVSCIGRWILYYWCHLESPVCVHQQNQNPYVEILISYVMILGSWGLWEVAKSSGQSPYKLTNHRVWICVLIKETRALPCPFSTISSVQFSHSVVSNSLQPHEPQQARPPCPSPTLELG